MPLEPSGRPLAIGSRIRAARQSQQLTIDHVAEVSGLTKGFLSRVERDITSPSVATLRTLCEVLSISIGSLFEEPSVQFVAASTGPRMNLGGVGAEERLVTPRNEDRLQVIRSKVQAGGGGGAPLYAVAADVDVVHVISGRIAVRFAADEWELGPGDTLTFNGREPHTWAVVGEADADVVWILAPAPWSPSARL